MKKIIILLLLLLCNAATFSQTAVLPTDERGKYTFLEVVELPAVKKDLMFANSKLFFKTYSKSIKLTETLGDSVFYGKGKMIINKNLAGIGHPTGEARYSLSLELREGKYRLILTDFIVTPYERDRYGNFVPLSVSTPIEESPGKLNKPEWEKSMSFIVAESKKMAEKLKTIMSNTAKDPKAESKKPVTISTKKW